MILKLKMLKQRLNANKHNYIKIIGGGDNLTGWDKRNSAKVELLKDIFNRNTQKVVDKITPEKSSYNIYVCWLQGIENAPEIVKVCYEMLLKNCGNRNVILITNDNFSQYINLPEYIIDKWKRGIISNTHFSDLIRVDLLCKYGGFWVDATALITNCRIFDKCEKNELAFPSFINIYPMNNWFLYAKKGDRILTTIKSCLLDYWNNTDELIDYFIWQMFAVLAYEYYKDEYKKIYIISHSCSHFLADRIMFQQYNKSDFRFLIKHCSDVHKLSYKFKEEQTKLNGTYYKAIISRIIEK